MYLKNNKYMYTCMHVYTFTIRDIYRCIYFFQTGKTRENISTVLKIVPKILKENSRVEYSYIFNLKQFSDIRHT